MVESADLAVDLAGVKMASSSVGASSRLLIGLSSMVRALSDSTCRPRFFASTRLGWLGWLAGLAAAAAAAAGAGGFQIVEDRPQAPHARRQREAVNGDPACNG